MQSGIESSCVLHDVRVHGQRPEHPSVVWVCESVENSDLSVTRAAVSLPFWMKRVASSSPMMAQFQKNLMVQIRGTEMLWVLLL